MENNLRFLELVWGVQRSGLYYTTVNSHLTPDEAAYIIDDCGARLIVSSSALSAVAAAIRPGVNPYYLRVRQRDGAMAWSSPIYVEWGADGG